MAIFAALALTACDDVAGVTRADMRAANMSLPPRMGWDGRPDGTEWTQAAMSALDGHGSRLAAFEPKDIDTYCPGYRSASVGQRQAFWAGLLSALAKHESTWREEAVGGGGQWFGLLQISPQTARGYGCDARSGSALLDGSSNLTCAIRIISVTAPRDGVIATKDSRWRGIAADWAPFQNQSKRAEIAAWTRNQDYCKASRKG